MILPKSFLVFFFFQAEDGIRDADVTGVQTCALPIYVFYNARSWCCEFYPWVFFIFEKYLAFFNAVTNLDMHGWPHTYILFTQYGNGGDGITIFDNLLGRTRNRDIQPFLDRNHTRSHYSLGKINLRSEEHTSELQSRPHL